MTDNNYNICFRMPVAAESKTDIEHEQKTVLSVATYNQSQN